MAVLSQTLDFSFPTYQDDLKEGLIMDFKEPQEKWLWLKRVGLNNPGGGCA